MEQLFISLAYKYVFLTLMVAEANYVLEKLDIPGSKSITMEQIIKWNVSPPRMRAGGSFFTTNCFFGFGENKLQFIQWIEPNSELSLGERQAYWSKMKSIIGTNEAYQLATNWLIKLEVDVDALQKRYPVTVQQEFYYPGGNTKQSPVMLPRFEVRWGENQSHPCVWVSIFGPTKTPLFIRQEDSSFIRRPNLIKTKEIEHLLSISNSDFINWTTVQKSNLVIQSAGNVYSSLILPEIISGANRDMKPLIPLIPKDDGNIVPRRKMKILSPLDR